MVAPKVALARWIELPSGAAVATVGGGGGAAGPAELMGEVLLMGETAFEGDFGYREVARFEQALGLLDAHVDEEAVRGAAAA